MSTNKTPNYDLHSWVPQDDFHMTEINENFTKLDTALKTEATAAAQGRSALQTALNGKASTSSVTALQTALNGKANTSTVTALQNAVNARIQMVVGSYTGNSAVNGTTSQHIQLGFRPKAVLIGYDRSFTDSLANPYGGLATTACSLYGAVTLDATGFTVVNIYDEQLRPNLDGIVYCYVAMY